MTALRALVVGRLGRSEENIGALTPKNLALKDDGRAWGLVQS